jgi:hypothetical protein
MVLDLSLQVDSTSPILHLSTGSIAGAGQPEGSAPFRAKYAPTGQKMGLSISMKYVACVEQPDGVGAAMMQAGPPPRFVGPAESALAVTENTTNQSTNIWNAFILVKSVLELEGTSSAVFCAPPLHIYKYILVLGIPGAFGAAFGSRGEVQGGSCGRGHGKKILGRSERTRPTVTPDATPAGTGCSFSFSQIWCYDFSLWSP